MKIFRLIKTRNPGSRGARYLYEVRDGNGRKISSTSDNKDYVAGLVGKHEREIRPGEFIYSLYGMTGKPETLGKAMTNGGRSVVFGIALIETVDIGGSWRPVIRTSAGDDFGPRGSDLDWQKLPAAFRSILPCDPFRTLKPIAGSDAATWIDVVDDDIPTPEAASSADTPAGSITPEPASPPAEDEPTEALKDPAIMRDADTPPPELFEAKCYKCGATFYVDRPQDGRPDCGTCHA